MQPVVNGFRQLASTIQSERSALHLSRWVFIRMLGVIYLIAFISLWRQIDGLIGHNGMLPVADYLNAVSEQLGPERCWWVPTFSWFNGSDGFLHLQCAAGVALSLLLIAGVAPVLDLLFLWAIYLSLSTVCRDFLSFQWDILLLESGFLVYPRPGGAFPDFLRPGRAQNRLRRFVPVYAADFLTGNYCFFNLLTVALCLLLLDDAFLLRLLPSSAAAFVNRRLTPPVASGPQPQEASRTEEVPRPVQSRSQTLNLPSVPPEERRRPADAPVEFPLWDGPGVG